MKRKWKWLVLILCIPVLCFAVWLWVVASRPIPVDVFGKLPAEDVAGIVAAVKREMRSEMLPDYSWRSVKAMPGVFKRNAKIKLLTVSVWLPEFVNVYVWLDTNGLPRYSDPTNYFFHGRTTEAAQKLLDLARANALNFRVSKGSNGWAVHRGMFTITTDGI